MRVRPCLAEAHEVLAPAFRTWPVAGGEGCRLVKEEELREPARTHQLPASAFELESAGDPPPNLPRPNQLTVIVVQHPPVAEQKPPRFGGDDVPERCDSVASRHGGHIVRQLQDPLILKVAFRSVNDSVAVSPSISTIR